MKRDKLRIGVITAALAMMIAGGVLTWQQDARNGKADQAKQGETAQLTEDESTGTTEQQTEETAGDADGTRAVQDQADDVENSLEQVPEMEAACEEEAAGNPEADAETAQNTPEESDGNTERQDAQAVNGTAADQNGETGSGETADTMELIRVTDELYNKVVDPAFVKKHGDLASVLAVTIEELTEYSWKDFLSEELYEDGLETYLERVSLDMTNFTSKEAEEKKEKTAGSDTKKIVVVDEKALARMYQYIQRNYGKTWLSESEEKSRNYQLCRGIHSDCSLYYTEGVLKNPVGKYYQLSYAQKQKDKNLHAYYDQHRAVRQNISLLYQELKKAMLLQEDQSFADADHGILQPARMWKVGRSQNADLFRLEQRRNSLDFVVDILVDASGSQRPRQENVTLQTYILAETLSRLHIPFRVMSFCTFWDYTILHRMRDYDDPREKNSNIFEYITSSNNRDGLAVKAAGMDLLKRQEDRKLLILLSDGKPYDVLVNRPNARNPKPYRDDYALHDTATEVRRLRQQGVSVLGVFVGEETELMAEQKIFGKDFAYARDIRNFSHMVGSYLRRKIEE